MNRKSLIILLIGSIINHSSAGSYCDKELCNYRDGKVYNHIACNNPGKFADICSPDAKIIPMTEDLQKLIITMSNQMREKIASGDIKGYESAKRMPIVRWDDELAELAILNVKKCEVKKDECLNTEACTYAGQNIGLSTGVTVFKNIKDEFIGIMHSWFNEYKLADSSVIRNFHKSENKLNWESFTVMVNHKVEKMGCAAATFTTQRGDADRNAILLTCNYGYTNIIDEPVYVAGEPCSKCESGCGNLYKSLCSEHEKIKPVPDFFLQRIRI